MALDFLMLEKPSYMCMRTSIFQKSIYKNYVFAK